MIDEELYRHMIGERLTATLFARDAGAPAAIITLATHGWANLGDHAIAYAQEAFLDEHFAGFPRFTIDRQTLAANWQRIVSAIRPDDILMLPGGGNLGDIWIHEEIARRRVVERFPGNAIVVFPQSIHFRAGRHLRESARVYSGHDRLLLAVRDDASYQIATGQLGVRNVVRTEDIAMTYQYAMPFREPVDEAAVIERDDVESRGTPALSALRSLIGRRLPTWTADTMLSAGFHSDDYAVAQLYRLVDELHARRIVVTDRLHGAIFGLHAGRPVIAVENSYGKLTGALAPLMPRLQGRLLIADDTASNITPDDVARLRAMPDLTDTLATLTRASFDVFADLVREFVARR
jgi:pyruvyl transferase EpsI